MSDLSVKPDLSTKEALENQQSGENAPSLPYWYKDAVIYQVHVKSYYDSNGDGIGDFAGLTQKLDYIQSLGVNTIWLLPFYPSPMRDDGYDIANYLNVASEYGTLDDFRHFVDEAHRRDLRIITELVINHTSEQHPWFQRARHAPPGSPEREFYVWNDDDKKYPETRIIFTDTETSNWAWDPVAKAYYWHRFFSHQPDLNHNNPAVVDAVIEVMRFWLDMGVDGVRLDAIPYLCVREGTDNENLPETHQVIKTMRAVVDQHYQDRLFLAEANQWPEDVRDYFGDADECHMAYHFPLMPRMYMAVAQEDRHPIVEIMHQTPNIPDSCQWAIFLRNHDELTLEMVTDKERDYMYQMYAADPQMRINVGIRRRLAPLMDNDRAKLKLLNSLLLSMPGSPIIYYGDEIGMGDNIYLGDRNSVRTPMQWTPDRNAGFSRAQPERLCYQPVRDPVYGYESVNVEAQSANSSSLLNWMRHLLTVRGQHPAFGRGSLTFLYPGNRKILAFIREFEGDVILCIANLSRHAQPVELAMDEWRGYVPVEMMGRTAFPPIGHLPYLLTIAGYGFYWFELKQNVDVPSWHEDHSLPDDAPVLVMFDRWRSVFPADAEPNRQELAQSEEKRLLHQALPEFIGRQRWFREQHTMPEHLAFDDYVINDDGNSLVGLFSVPQELASDHAPFQIFMPLNLIREADEAHMHFMHGHTVARWRQKDKMGIVGDAAADPYFCATLIRGVAQRQQWQLAKGQISFHRHTSFDIPADSVQDLLEAHVDYSSNSNGSSIVVLDKTWFVKVYRLVEEGEHPELEMKRFLTEEVAFEHVAPLLGSMSYTGEDGKSSTLALLQGYVKNQGDAWQYVQGYLLRYMETCFGDMAMQEGMQCGNHEPFLTMIDTLGQRTADLHNALAKGAHLESFCSESATEEDLASWCQVSQSQMSQALDLLADKLDVLTPASRHAAERLLEQRQFWLEQLAGVNQVKQLGHKQRYHGNFHLGRLLMVDNDYLITGFEGETTLPMTQRHAKGCPLRDIASMLRSFNFVAQSVLEEMTMARPNGLGDGAAAIVQWEKQVSDRFLNAYVERLSADVVLPDLASQRRLVALFIAERGAREMLYDLQNRVDKIGTTLSGFQQQLANWLAE